ncbi:MAG: BamA/TamA family outer membrane protein, partial [Ignavibacteria bacterium]
AFTALNKGGYDIFYIDNPFDIDLKIEELPNTKFVEKLLQSQEISPKDSVSVTEKNTPNNFEFQKETEVSYNISIPDSSIVNTNINLDTNKIYGDDINLVLNPKDDTLKPTVNKIKLKEKSKFRLSNNVNEDGSLKVNKYKIKFSPDIIYSNVNYSSFYGVQGVAQMAFSDVLGNHRIFIVTSLVLDLKNSDYAFAYYYLPKRIDYGFEAYHSARFLLFNTISNNERVQNLFRYRTYGAILSASYPINKFNRLDGVLSYSSISKENLDNPNEPTQTLRYVLPIVNFVHDNTLFGYTAPIRGKRFNLTLLGTPKIGSQGVSFLSAIGDYRTYIKLLDDYNFVWRLSGGVSVGKNPQRFYIGGTSNWINYEVQNNVFPIEEISDFAFSTPVLPLRGYNYNTRSGSKFILMNTELRFPLFKYLVLGPLPLAFQNIQGVMFADVGTAWTDNKSLQFFTKQDGRFKTKDLLLGLGIGARIFLLYFPLKFDVAWSYDLHKFSSPKYYISLGADF